MNSKKLIIISLISFAIVVSVFFLTKNVFQDVSDASNVFSSNEKISNNWETHISVQLGVKISYPEDWQFNEFNDELDNYIEIKSSENIQYADKLSGQVIYSPLSTITIRKDQLPKDTNFEVWAEQRVNNDSIQNQELYYINGYQAIRQWVWNKQNAFSFSSINYYIQMGADIVSLRNTIMNEDPDSTQFINAEKMGDEIFSHFEII